MGRMIPYKQNTSVANEFSILIFIRKIRIEKYPENPVKKSHWNKVRNG